MAAALHFDSAFWSQKRPQEPLPDFQTGLSVLHSKLNQSKVENDELISFFKDRIAVEDTYASRLADQAKTSLKSSGFGRDEGAGLKSCFENLRAASGRFGNQHKETANLMTETVLRPLQRLQEEYKRNILVSKQSVDAALKQFDSLVKDMDKARSTYQKKYRELKIVQEQVQLQQQQQQQTEPTTESADETTTVDTATASRSPPDKKENATAETTVILGNQQLPQPEFDALMRRMYSEIPVGDHRVPILGKYSNTSTGEDISIWLQQNLPQCKDSPAMADVVAQQLIHPLGVLRLVGQRGNKFSSSAQSFYQWRLQRDDENASLSTTNANNGYAITGFFERIGAVQPALPGEDSLKRVQREVASADEAYRTSVKRIDQMRMVVEQALFAHFAEMEQVELRRIGSIKEIFEAYSRCITKLLPEEKAIIDDMLVYQESLKPEQDIQYIVQQYFVAGFGPKPILYENDVNGVALDQTFGVPLEDLGNQSEDHIPAFVRCVLEAIEAGKDALNDEERTHLWSTRIPLARVHTVRVDLDIPSSQIDVDMLKQHPPIMLVAILRLFLLELPEPLMTFDFYDAGQTLYSNSAQDESLRLLSLGNLIANLPGSHFETLRTLLKHIYSHVEKLQDKRKQQDEIAAISRSLGPVILRPRLESLTSLTSRVPASISQDLITHYNEIFNENTLKSHQESEKRRLARPLVASKSDYQLADKDVNNKQQQQQQQPQQRRGLMSFMRSSAEDTNASSNKWSMRGVFQRASNTGASSDSLSDMQQRSSSSSFTRSTAIPMSGSGITQGSPLSSPPKSSEIVFDLADHVQQENKVLKDDGNEQEEKQQGNDDDTKNQTLHDKDELDPFFADD